MWSVGVLFYILICGKPPFEGRDLTELQNNIIKSEFVF
jgi:serine/threonine protein kinase